ncbi:hypothetical protein PoB_005811100 [Plakobranchus ocellatus]|uniref:Uncharacterized protein n=1 Tax=Plakobranchus ocellatus TaxID=259542 RepID=A0AAV4CJD1_9GAST|nr:hypothetical protein PoB_005811100 [Plakobranchus ocellatus]
MVADPEEFEKQAFKGRPNETDHLEQLPNFQTTFSSQLNSHARDWFTVVTNQGAGRIDAGQDISHTHHCAPAAETTQVEANWSTILLTCCLFLVTEEVNGAFATYSSVKDYDVVVINIRQELTVMAHFGFSNGLTRLLQMYSFVPHFLSRDSEEPLVQLIKYVLYVITWTIFCENSFGSLWLATKNEFLNF